MADDEIFTTVDSADAETIFPALPGLTDSAQPATDKHPPSLDGTVPSYNMRTIYDDAPLQYGHARNIRVLQIARGDVDGFIICELSTISVHGSTPYTAVSYEWGSDVDQRTILVGGEPFKVRQNLWQFLTQMQRVSQGRSFWIDAICIQQANVHERNHQVAMMGDIYSNADKVIVWLGAEQIPFRNHGLLEMIRRATLDPDISQNDGRIELRECLRQLAKNTYWTRAWILQEFVLGPSIELRYGSGFLQEDVFREFWVSVSMVGIGRSSGLFGEETTRIYDMKRIVFYRLQRQRVWLSSRGSSSESSYLPFHSHGLHCLEQLSEEFAQTRCSDPRDRIYALLSLVATIADQ